MWKRQARLKNKTIEIIDRMEERLMGGNDGISELIKNHGGKSFISKHSHETGTDRVFEAFNQFYLSKPQIIINLQGDMPNLNSNDIINLNNYIKSSNCDVATLASDFATAEEISDKNVVKVETKQSINVTRFSEAFDLQNLLG